MKRYWIYGLFSLAIMLSSISFSGFLAYQESDFANVEEPDPFIKK
ncbi:hypothetical protein [Ornithinibacillus bavariensis]|uniref:Uncharacterized protein n=1 Tax=Ornithinibacillus bavariensis TaxID=545502 RepID=A0A919X5K5_9BACI|nr:hypothetical protein [Ornithinibacillus bavariensis]GIO25951.1 hypothetical protein J43TS3_05620 [Ornithinibacillus bavariensis]